MSCPSTSTVPCVGLTIPQTMLISVVLSAPFGPSSAKISPRRISRLTFLTAESPDAYVFDRLETEMIGDIGRAGLTEVEAYRIVPKRRRVGAISDLARERRCGSIVRHWERAQRRLPMAHDTRITSGLTSIVASVALGAIAMYAFDPDKGRRRRALARDKAVSVLLDTRHAAGATRRDVTHRLLGLRARALRLWTRQPTTDDLQLIERVRARMGRMVSHPHAIQV